MASEDPEKVRELYREGEGAVREDPEKVRELYAAVVASEHPEKVRELLAYQAMKPAGVVGVDGCSTMLHSGSRYGHSRWRTLQKSTSHYIPPHNGGGPAFSRTV